MAIEKKQRFVNGQKIVTDRREISEIAVRGIENRIDARKVGEENNAFLVFIFTSQLMCLNRINVIEKGMPPDDDVAIVADFFEHAGRVCQKRGGVFSIGPGRGVKDCFFVRV